MSGKVVLAMMKHTHIVGRALKVSEAAAELQVCPVVVYRAIERGDLPSIRLGRLVRIPRSAFEEFLKGSVSAQSVEVGKTDSQ